MDGDSGVVMWTTQLPDRVESCAVVVAHGDEVAVGCYDGFLYVLAVVDGRVVWCYHQVRTLLHPPVHHAAPYKYVYTCTHAHSTSVDRAAERRSCGGAPPSQEMPPMTHLCLRVPPRFAPPGSFALTNPSANRRATKSKPRRLWTRGPAWCGAARTAGGWWRSTCRGETPCWTWRRRAA